MGFVWIVHCFDFSEFKLEMHIFTHPQYAYNFCRDYLKKYEKEDFYSDYCCMLYRSYSNSRSDFGIENVISVKKYKIEK